MMKTQQAKSDERDNKRVFRWGIGAAITVLLLALLYNLLVQTREEGPVKPEAPAQPPQPVSPAGGPAPSRGPTGPGAASAAPDAAAVARSRA